MGFRCPVCHEDFGCDEKAHIAHIAKEHEGTGLVFKMVLQDMAEKERCNNCMHWEICSSLICSLTGKETQCDFEPSRYKRTNIRGAETCQK